MSNRNSEEDEILTEYDFPRRVRSPYAQSLQGLNLVSLNPKVKSVFLDSEAVNEASRLLIKVARASVVTERFSLIG